jgi:hypothetical protein
MTAVWLPWHSVHTKFHKNQVMWFKNWNVHTCAHVYTWHGVFPNPICFPFKEEGWLKILYGKIIQRMCSKLNTSDVPKCETGGFICSRVIVRLYEWKTMSVEVVSMRNSEVKKGVLERSFQIGNLCLQCFIHIDDAVNSEYAPQG